MKRILIATLSGAFCLLSLASGSASAQAYPYNRPNYGPFAQPPLLSPYLNLLRGGDPAANYFLGTIPEIQRRQNTQIFGAAILDLEQRRINPLTGEVDLGTPLPGTGHPTAFLNTGTYFGQNNPRVPAASTQPPRPKR